MARRRKACHPEERRNTMVNFDGTVAVVTGSGSGIGQALARKCAARGATVAVVDIDLAKAQETSASIHAARGKAAAYEGDTTDLERLQELAERIESEHGAINAAFNNAGVFTAGPLDRTRPNDFAWVFDVNVRGTYNSILAFLPAIRRSAQAGRPALIVNTGSENSVAVPTMGPFSAYTATKHAVLGLTDTLRRDLAGENIQVALLCPGLVTTNLWNAKRARQERFGGSREAPVEAAAVMEEGRTPDETAQTLFEGLDAGEFIIITDPRIRSFTDPRLHEIAAALDACDARVIL
jgi:NAD(P)-dependent dehydrogenase (short-subunit alcohol dehydrogenase family)